MIAESENGVRIGNFAHSPLGNLLTDAWLESFPEADFAISNLGGLRQPIRAGKITLGDVIGVLPFDNTLYMVSISGQDLKDELTNNYPVVGGMKYVWQTLQNGNRKIQKIFDRNGKEILDNSKYKVVTTNFLYLGGDNFKFKEKDTAPQKTGINWRDPLIAKIRKIKDQSKYIDFIPDVRAIEAQEY